MPNDAIAAMPAATRQTAGVVARQGALRTAMTMASARMSSESAVQTR